MPPAGSAGPARVWHMMHLLPLNGVAGLVPASRSVPSDRSGSGYVRNDVAEADSAYCMTALPGEPLCSAALPARLRLFSGKRQDKGCRRRGKALFVDARSMGRMAYRTRRVLNKAGMQNTADAYHAWQNEKECRRMPGFCKIAGADETRRHGHMPAPGRYAGAAPQAGGGPLEHDVRCPAAERSAQKPKARRLDGIIAGSLNDLAPAATGAAA